MHNKSMNKEITVFLTEQDAVRFMNFQKYYNEFMLFVNKGVFDQKNSAITLHFDSNGILQTIQRADFMYSRKHEG